MVAYFMGFKEIYLLGADFNYPDKEDTHFYPMGKREHERSDMMEKNFTFIENSARAIVSNCAADDRKYVNLSKGFIRHDIMPTDNLENVKEEYYA